MRFSLPRFIVACVVGWVPLCATAEEPAKSSDLKPAPAAGAEAAGEEFFERKIRPLLAQHCFSCHGRGQKKGGLSLDSREGMMAGGDSGAAVVLEKPDASLLMEAVRHESLQMPPDKKMAGDEIAALGEWLAMGAPWPAATAGAAARAAGSVSDEDRKFWSFQPIGDPQPPAVKQAAAARRPLDRFVLARLEAEGLQPVGDADRRTLIRRLSFDLIGLPPTAEEIEAFAADTRPDAYERLVDRLLASPHYGERQARHWLDLARYGEDQAHTFAARMYPNGYRYRDWVVGAFNRDLPYDRFIVEQLAGDLLDEMPTAEKPAAQKIAAEKGAHAAAGDEAKKARLPALGFMALGPVYYADAGCAGKAKTDEYDDRIDTLCRSLLGLTVACARCHDHKFDPVSTADYYALAGVFASTQYVEAPLVGADEVKRYDDAQAKVKEAEQRLRDGQTAEARRLGESFAGRTADYLTAVAAYERRKKKEPGHTIDAAAKEAGLDALVLERWRQRLETDRTGKLPLLAPWRDAAEKGSDAERRAGAEAIQATLLAAIEKRRASEAQTPKKAVDAATADVLKTLVDDRSAPLAIPRDQVDKRLPADRKKHLADLQKAIDEAKKAVGPKYAFAHTIAEGSATNMKIHVRGNHKELGEEVPRRFLSVLSAGEAKPFASGSGRLELARAIASPGNPLTARVMVNRIWHQLFGRGIVGTPSNFGLLGERPTHPELLDHLATRFVAGGWSVKGLVREIVLSSTYRRASTFDAGAYARDPDNRLLWRMNRRRLDVESWRDAVLAACGNLDTTLGGPSANLNDAGNRRRTLYAAVSRHDLNPMLRIFDFPDPNLTSERRVITTVPMQQLFVLNSEFMIRQSKGLAARIADKKGADGKPIDESARIEGVYRSTLGRTPTAEERAMVVRFLAAAEAERDAKLTPWEQLAQALLSTNEFTYVD